MTLQPSCPTDGTYSVQMIETRLSQPRDASALTAQSRTIRPALSHWLDDTLVVVDGNVLG